jgi:hypothetical protein
MRNAKGQFIRKYEVNDNVFECIEDDYSAYVLGIISSDGGVFENKLTITQCGIEGEKMLNWVKDMINSNHGLYHLKSDNEKHNDIYRLTIVSDKIVNDLLKYNITKNKKYLYNYPINLDNRYMKSFIRGYFDGDGCVGVYNGKKIKNGKTYYHKYLKMSFYGTKDFILKCKDILPYKPSVVLNKEKTHGEIIWTHKRARDIANWLFDDNLYLSKKKIKYLKYIEERLG